MSREFRGAVNSDEIITAGGAVTADGGPLTYLVLWKPLAAVAGGLIRVWKGGFVGAWSVNPYSDSNAYFSTGSFVSAPYALDGWRIDGFTHVSGGQVRSHRYSYAGGTWTHANLGTLGNVAAGAVAEIWHGHYVGTEYVNARFAVEGVWNSVLTDLAIEGLTTSLAAWLALSPAALWPYNQANVTDPVLDLTGNGANQTSRNGTIVSADDPPGFNYALSSPAQGSASFAMNVGLAAAGRRASLGTAAFAETLTLAASGVTARRGSAALGMAVSLAAGGGDPATIPRAKSQAGLIADYAVGLGSDYEVGIAWNPS